MEAGRELDRMIAEKVFERDPLLARHGVHADGDIEYYWNTYLGHDIAPYYSTDIAAAWKIVEKITTPGDPVAYKQVQDLPAATRFYWLFDHADLWAMNSQEAATTICNLALRALGLISPKL